MRDPVQHEDEGTEKGQHAEGGTSRGTGRTLLCNVLGGGSVKCREFFLSFEGCEVVPLSVASRV
jgi:hypothetical protein